MPLNNKRKCQVSRYKDTKEIYQAGDAGQSLDKEECNKNAASGNHIDNYNIYSAMRDRQYI